MEFYYDLASLLIQDDATACLVHPFPGHLTRYPMVGRYAEKPLNRFISDPSDLFRQYLRFMVESQWLLSALTPVSNFHVPPGISLLRSHDVAEESRCNPDRLSDSIEHAWRMMHQRCAELLNTGGESRGNIVDREGIRDSVTALRDLLGWRAADQPLASMKPPKLLPSPSIHVIGYSLGGYLAQSAFFTWPFAISSCTTICSGGALNDLRPVKFAHEEEWRSIMHGLKYELDSGMLERRIRTDDESAGTVTETPASIAGIPADEFSSHFRMFNEVFLQDSHGSYRSRVSEFSPRLLFIVGGNDPIVTTRSVLDASPSEGINMIQVANLGHFVANTGNGEWTHFWLPTVSKLLFAFAHRATSLHSQSVLGNPWNPELTGPPANCEWSTRNAEWSGTKRPRDKASEALDSERFQRELMSLVTPLERSNSRLLIFRNQIPTALMGSRLLHRRGTVPHYEDFLIREYWEGLRKRREAMLKQSSKVTLVIPAKLGDWFVGTPPILSVKSEPTVRTIPSVDGLKAIWSDFIKCWGETGSLFCFDPERPEKLPENEPRFALEMLVRERTRTEEPHPVLNCLPEVWIGLSEEVVEALVGTSDQPEVMEKCFHQFVFNLYREQDGGHGNPWTTRKDLWINKGALRIIRVSGADSNSAFLGERIWDSGRALDFLVHAALALARSRRYQAGTDAIEAPPP